MYKLSILTALYKSEFNIPSYIQKLEELQTRIKDQFEIELILIDDGSPDKSYEVALEYKKSRDWIKIIKLSRNFGVPYGLLAGLHKMTGDCAVFLVPDLQDPPHLIDEMLQKWIEGHKIVLAERVDREEPMLQKIVSNVFHFLMKKFALPNYPKQGSDLILIDKVIVNKINNINEKNTNLLCLILWTGYEHVSIPYTRKAREIGKSSFTFNKKVKVLVDSFIAFSYLPIRAISLIGLVVSILSFFYGVFVIANTLFFGNDVKGFTTTVSLITFLLGLIMFMLGIIGEYLWRILDEARKRPQYIIDKEHM